MSNVSHNVYGRQVHTSSFRNGFVGQSTKPGATGNDINTRVRSDVYQQGDTVRIHDEDSQPNLRVSLTHDEENGAQLHVTNSDNGASSSREEHVVKNSFNLPGVSAETVDSLQDQDLTWHPRADRVLVTPTKSGGAAVQVFNARASHAQLAYIVDGTGLNRK